MNSTISIGHAVTIHADIDVYLYSTFTYLLNNFAYLFALIVYVDWPFMTDQSHISAQLYPTA